ncbi:Glycosyltransferase involved in cell wall bisynthesis [Nitrosovibrio sp. Nv4]|nr:Glycosyltransferase involved in cell wall bisynthesis [Nitrosovibrio sp. Nv4]
MVSWGHLFFIEAAREFLCAFSCAVLFSRIMASSSLKPESIAMHLSIIIPAFNEERLIEQCLQSVYASLATNSQPGFTSEIIVVDNNSTDNTANLARQAGARVVFEPVNQIGRARNAGAAEATGDWLLFVDADSILNPELLADILQLIEGGKYVGCGSAIRMEGLPWWADGVLKLWTVTSVMFRWAAGALVVSRSDAFRDVGGFDQELYAADEVTLSQKLKKWGQQRGLQFVILTKHPLESSARKVQLYSGREIAGQILRVLLRPRRTLQDKKHLSVWYDGRR